MQFWIRGLGNSIYIGITYSNLIKDRIYITVSAKLSEEGFSSLKIRYFFLGQDAQG